MTKLDVIENLYEKLNLPRKEIVKVVDSVFDIIREILQKEDKLMVSGFGDFIIRNKKARKGRNPKTGSDIVISARRILTFKPARCSRQVSINRRRKTSLKQKPPIVKSTFDEKPKKGERRRIRLMTIEWKLKKVEDRLIKDLKETTLPFRSLGKKYGVSGQSIFWFCQRRGIKRQNRPNIEHTKNCPICKSLIRSLGNLTATSYPLERSKRN